MKNQIGITACHAQTKKMKCFDLRKFREQPWLRGQHLQHMVNGLWVRIPSGSLVAPGKASDHICSYAPKLPLSKDLLQHFSQGMKTLNRGAYFLLIYVNFKHHRKVILCLLFNLPASTHFDFNVHVAKIYIERRNSLSFMKLLLSITLCCLF